MKLNLYDYQEVGVDFMYNTPKCLNLDDPGLGKTPQSLALIERLSCKVLLVVKPENIMQWKDEIRKFTDLSFVLVDGSKNKRARQYNDFVESDTRILLINYNKVIYDYPLIKNISNCFGLAVFDEAFALKSPTSSIHTSFEIITKRIPRIVMLTATPVGATLYDFYNILKVMHIPHLMPEDKFIERYLVTSTVASMMGYKSYARFRVFEGSKNIDEFRDWIEPFYIRRKNNEYLKDIQPIIHRHPLQMTDEQKICCQLLKQQFLNQGPNDKPVSTLSVYSKFSQIVSSPYLIDDSLDDYSPKVEELLHCITSTDEQVVVYAKYLEFHDILIKYFKLHHISYSLISGKLSTKQKDNEKKKFIAGETQVLLMTGAGKVGLNLQTSHIIYFCDVPATPSDTFQFIGRVYRDGQQQDVDVHFLYMQDSLEEDSFSSLISKQKDIDVLFEQDKASLFEGLPTRDKMVSFLKRDYEVA